MNLGAWREVTDVYGGKITKASYKLADRMVTVKTSFSRMTATIGGDTPERLARTLLRKMVDRGA